MKNQFKKGDTVTWISQAGGNWKTKTGTIVAIIPANASASSIADTTNELYEYGNISRWGFGLPRDHESYLVAVPSQSSSDHPKLFWPDAWRLSLKTELTQALGVEHPKSKRHSINMGTISIIAIIFLFLGVFLGYMIGKQTVINKQIKSKSNMSTEKENNGKLQRQYPLREEEAFKSEESGMDALAGIADIPSQHQISNDAIDGGRPAYGSVKDDLAFGTPGGIMAMPDFKIEDEDDYESMFPSVETRPYDAANPTFGQKAVGITFNPSGDDKVFRLKMLHAEIIDIMNDFRMENHSGNANRHASAAITEAETSQMRAVKAVTWKE